MTARKRSVLLVYGRGKNEAWRRAVHLACWVGEQGGAPLELPKPQQNRRGQWMVWVEWIGPDYGLGRFFELGGFDG